MVSDFKFDFDFDNTNLLHVTPIIDQEQSKDTDATGGAQAKEDHPNAEAEGYEKADAKGRENEDVNETRESGSSTPS